MPCFSTPFSQFSMAPLSSLVLSPPPILKPNHNFRLASPFASPRTESLTFFRASSGQNDLQDPPRPPPPQPPPSEKKSFAVATGELFIGLTARFIKPRLTRSTESVPIFDAAEKQFPKREGYFGWRRDRIATVIEDPIDPGVVWEQHAKDVEAERARRAVTSPGFSFSAAGLLFPYHLGVAHFLLGKGYIKDTTPLAGASAGAIVCATIASGASMEEALKATKVLAEDCRLKGTAFRLGTVLRDVLVQFLPDDVHIRSNGRIRVAVTQVLWRPRGLLVDKFDSKEDLINAVCTSSFIPGYFAPRPATFFRNRLCIDGGLTLFMPPTCASQTVLY